MHPLRIIIVQIEITNFLCKFVFMSVSECLCVVVFVVIVVTLPISKINECKHTHKLILHRRNSFLTLIHLLRLILHYIAHSTLALEMKLLYRAEFSLTTSCCFKKRLLLTFDWLKAIFRNGRIASMYFKMTVRLGLFECWS